MNPLLGHFGYLHWFLLAGVLLILELFIPGVLLLWFGLAAVVLGAVMHSYPELAPGFQIGILATVSGGTVLAWRAFVKWRNDRRGGRG